MDFTKESVSANSKDIIGVTWSKMGKIAGTGLLKMDGTGHLVLLNRGKLYIMDHSLQLVKLSICFVENTFKKLFLSQQ